jgi:hypothetical protein
VTGIVVDLAARCTVAIYGGERFLGSGFLVAPGRVLTCAHVAAEGGPGPLTVRLEDGELTASLVRLIPPQAEEPLATRLARTCREWLPRGDLGQVLPSAAVIQLSHQLAEATSGGIAPDDWPAAVLEISMSELDREARRCDYRSSRSPSRTCPNCSADSSSPRSTRGSQRPDPHDEMRR